MNRPVTNPDTAPPSAPGNAAATGSLSSAQLTWSAATDNVGVVRYNVHRGTSAGFTPAAGQPDRAADRHELHRHRSRPAPTTTGHRRGRRRQRRRPSNEATAQVGDLTPPARRGRSPRVGSVGRATLSWGAATDNVGVVRYNVHRGPDAELHPRRRRTGSRSRPGTGYVDTTVAGHLLLQGHRRGRSRQRRRRLQRGDRDRDRGHDRADRADRPRRHRRRRHRQPDLDRLDRRRRRRPLQRPPRHDAGLHALRPRTGSRSRPARATATPASRRGTYYYKVTAEDAAGNVSAASNEARGDRRGRDAADARRPGSPRSPPAARSTSRGRRATDNVGVARYNVHRGDDLRVHAVGRRTGSPSRPAPPTRIARSAPGTYFYKLTAEDAAGNLGPVSNTGSATVARHDRAHRADRPRRHRRRGPGVADLDGGERQRRRRRYNVHRGTTAGLHPDGGNRIAQPTGTSYADTGLAAGHLLLPRHRRGRGRQRRRRRPTRRPPPSTPPRRRSRRGLRLRRRAPARRPPTSPATATTARSRTARPGRATRASSATRSASTASTTSSRSPTRTRSTSRPG